jgi:hypothetical protein
MISHVPLGLDYDFVGRARGESHQFVVSSPPVELSADMLRYEGPDLRKALRLLGETRRILLIIP